MQFEAEFPARPAFMSTPNEYRFARSVTDKIHEPQPLPHSKSLRNNRQAAFRANIHSVAFRSQIFPRVRPFHSHCNTGIQAPAATDLPWSCLQSSKMK